MCRDLTMYLHWIHFNITALQPNEVTMKVETEIKKWGNSLALRVTGIMATLPRFEAGTKVIVDVSDEGLMVKPSSRSKDSYRFPYTESELLADLTPEKAHADELAKLTLPEFGD